jgi:hypothetical protein
MARVYKLYNENQIYIGSTKKPLEVRLAEHIITHYNHTKGNKYVISSFDIIDSGCFAIELIEECTSENRYQREQFYIKSMDCVNKTFKRDTSEWASYVKQYYYRNREKECLRKRQYYQNNKKRISLKREAIKLYRNPPFH